jgi:apolipoprotein N-acyltransferase
VTLGAGAVTALAFPEPSIAPIAWFSIAPLLLVAEGIGLRRGAALGVIFGLGFFGVLIYWISIVGIAAWIALVLLQSLYVGLFGAMIGALPKTSPAWLRVLLPAVLWVGLVESLRGSTPLGGFTWGQLAQSQVDVPHLLSVSGIAGGWGLAFLLVTVNSLVALAWRTARSSGSRTAAGAFAGAVLLLSAPLLLPGHPDGGRTIRVALVQGNVPLEIPSLYERDLAIVRSHRHLTEELHDVDLVVWPESAIGIDPTRVLAVRREVEAAARGAGAPMIVGGNLDRDDGRYQVMAFHVAADGTIVDQYQKTHLVPFGEFVPARPIFGWIPALDQVPRDAVPGEEGRLFDIAGGKVAPVISFEGDFGSLVRQRIAMGGRLLVVATNTSTWRRSWASEQHVAMSRVRAAENGVYVVHAAISGISGIISPSGELLQRSQMWLPRVLVQDVPFADSVSLYARTGDWLAWLCLLGTGIFVVFRLKPRREVASDDDRQGSEPGGG